MLFFCIVVRYDQGMIRATTGKNKRTKKGLCMRNQIAVPLSLKRKSEK